MTCEIITAALSWLLVGSPIFVALGLMMWALVRHNRDTGEFTGDQIDGGGR